MSTHDVIADSEGVIPDSKAVIPDSIRDPVPRQPWIAGAETPDLIRGRNDNQQHAMTNILFLFLKDFS
jgi:hypothetical protein